MAAPDAIRKILLISDRPLGPKFEAAAESGSDAEAGSVETSDQPRSSSFLTLADAPDLSLLPVEYAAAEGKPLVFYSSSDAAEADLDPREIALIIIDLHDDGAAEEALRLTERVLQSEAFANTPVLIIGDASSPETLADLFAAGAADFIQRGSALSTELAPRVRLALQRSQEWYRLKRKTGELQRMTEDLKTANIIFRSISIHDDLTGVANRRFFDRYLDTVWRQAMRATQPVSLILIDIDYFKKYNDTYGHQAGDECLRSVAQAMNKTLDEHGCILARYGGEEFAAILPGLDSSAARTFADRLQATVFDLALVHSGSPDYGRVTISQGIATAIPGLLMRPSKLIAKADRALYQAKAAGRNRSVA